MSSPTTPTEVRPWLTVSTPRRGWLLVLATLGGMFLGGVFLVAAYAKTLDPAAFATQIRQEGLDFLLPAPAVAMIALGLEVFLGTALLFGIRRAYVLWPTAALVVFFLFLTGRTYYRDVQGTLPEDAASCGCFGNLVERTPAEAFWGDLLLMVPALLLALAARRVDPVWPHTESAPRGRLAAVGVLTAATLLVAWKAPELPLDDLATRLRPGTDALGLCAESADGTRVCLSDIVAELAAGEHVVILADLGDELGADVDWLNEYFWSGNEPTLWIVTSASDEASFLFRFTHGPAFEPREAPPALLRPLYRTLPRSFSVRDGRVVETWSGLPPLERWGAPARREPTTR